MEFNRFDVTTKELVWDDPAKCLERFDRVVRLWEESPDSYLTAGLNLLPLAPLTNVAAEQLPDIVRRIEHRINAEPPPRAAKLWTATYLLMGL